MSSTARWRPGTRRQRQQPDALKARDGALLPVWSAEATDPVDYLASVIDQLRDTRSVATVQPSGAVSR